jgi:LysM repeat protein
MKRVKLLVSICVVLAAATACRLIAPTPDPAEIQRLVAEAVRATIEAMPTATPYPTYTPVPLAPTYTPSVRVYTPRPTHTVVSASPELQAGSTFRTHIVVAGDTLSGIAKEYGTTVEAIMGANDLSDPGLIIVGQVLSIPIGEAGSASTPTTPTPLLTPTTTLTSTTPTLLTPTAAPTATPSS